MDYMKNFFETQQKMYETFQDNFNAMLEKKGGNPFQKNFENFMEMQKQMMGGFSSTENPFAMYQKMFETPGFSPEAYKSFLDMQKLYVDGVQKFNDFFNKGFESYDFMPYNFKNVQDAFDKYQSFYSNYDFTKFMDPQMSEVMSKIYGANKFYLQMYEFWNTLTEDFVKSVDMDSDKLMAFLEKNADVTYELMTSAFPGELKVFFGGAKEILEKYFNTLTNFYSPWKNELGALKDLFFHGTIENDPKKISEFFEVWRAQYDQTFGKIFNSPALGISRTQIEQQNKMIDSIINVFIKSAEFSANLNTAQNNAFKNIMTEYVQLAKEGLELKTFEEFYAFYAKKMDQNLVEYFGSEEFSKLLAQFGEAFMDLKTEYNKLVELYLADTPLVTVGKVDSMIKNIYDLKKEVKALKKEVEELKAVKKEEK